MFPEASSNSDLGMPLSPKISYIVLSYNYRHYIEQTIRSIFDQSAQDLEVIIVDDCSQDGSIEFIKSIGDDRVRLYVNDINRGGAWSYNRAVSLARGEFLVNLDADDWVSPEKSERQLALFEADPSLDIVGTYITAVDSNGQLHANRSLIENFCNQPFNLNDINSWVVQNPLCRSSTMMRRSAHTRIGLDDPSMVYTCDWELWTRALREGCRFAVLQEPLTFYRWHGGNITHKNPRAQLFEIAYLLGQNVVPIIERRAAYNALSRVFSWFLDYNEQFARLRAAERYRLLASLISLPRNEDFATFSARMQSPDRDVAAERLGRLCLALLSYSPNKIAELAYYRNTQAYERDKQEWFIPRIEHLEQELLRGGEETARLQSVAAEYERVKEEWFIPRMEHLEQELLRGQEETARLQSVVTEQERVKRIG
jgi:glycosyltransferase involved in cell wall biosynthesis